LLTFIALRLGGGIVDVAVLFILGVLHVAVIESVMNWHLPFGWEGILQDSVPRKSGRIRNFGSKNRGKDGGGGAAS